MEIEMTTTKLAWWNRAGQSPWMLAACEDHGKELAELRFTLGTDGRYRNVGEPTTCPFCSGVTKFDDVRRCRCEVSEFRCPIHGDPGVEHVEPLVVQSEERFDDVLEATRAVDDYAWDRWHRRALAAGLDDELAALGRSLFREAYQHSWGDELSRECGWADGGAAMLKAALEQPDQIRERWTYLMDTDGERGHWNGNEWVSL